jgi:hypothetical protein
LSSFNEQILDIVDVKDSEASGNLSSTIFEIWIGYEFIPSAKIVKDEFSQTLDT